MLLAEAQHRRLHGAFGWFRPNCLVLVVCLLLSNGQFCIATATHSVYRQEEEPAEEAKAAAGEDELLHSNTIGDCDLHSLLIHAMKNVCKKQDMNILPFKKYSLSHNVSI